MTEILKDNIIELRDIIIRQKIYIKYGIYDDNLELKELYKLVINKHRDIHGLESIKTHSMIEATKVMMGDI